MVPIRFIGVWRVLSIGSEILGRGGRRGTEKRAQRGLPYLRQRRYVWNFEVIFPLCKTYLLAKAHLAYYCIVNIRAKHFL